VRQDLLRLQQPARPLALAPGERPVPGPAMAVADLAEPGRFAWVCGWAYMRSFIAGQSTTGASVASSVAVRRSSAMPAAARARKLAVAGATTTTSASRASGCGAAAPGRVGRGWAARPVTASKESGRTNSSAPAREDDLDDAPVLRQLARQVDRLVRRDPAGDAQENAAPREGTPRASKWPPRRLQVVRPRPVDELELEVRRCATNSSAIVVSFSRGVSSRSPRPRAMIWPRRNSFSMRAYFAATSTPRYLLRCGFTAPGVIDLHVLPPQGFKSDTGAVSRQLFQDLREASTPCEPRGCRDAWCARPPPAESRPPRRRLLQRSLTIT
jgi:hypothetical protein